MRKFLIITLSLIPLLAVMVTLINIKSDFKAAQSNSIDSNWVKVEALGIADSIEGNRYRFPGTTILTQTEQQFFFEDESLTRKQLRVSMGLMGGHLEATYLCSETRCLEIMRESKRPS